MVLRKIIKKDPQEVHESLNKLLEDVSRQESSLSDQQTKEKVGSGEII